MGNLVKSIVMVQGILDKIANFEGNLWIFWVTCWLPKWISIINSKYWYLYRYVSDYIGMRSNEFFRTKSCTKYSINLQENSRHSIGLTLRRAGHFERWPNFVCSFWKFLFFQNIIMILSFFSCLIRLKKFNDFFSKSNYTS